MQLMVTINHSLKHKDLTNSYLTVLAQYTK